jgi:hypothetical protein
MPTDGPTKQLTTDKSTQPTEAPVSSTPTKKPTTNSPTNNLTTQKLTSLSTASPTGSVRPNLFLNQFEWMVVSVLLSVQTRIPTVVVEMEERYAGGPHAMWLQNLPQL